MASPAVSNQQGELEQLKTAFPGKVKVISNIGEFTNVVSIRPAEFDLQLKFQLTDSYPATPPVISVTSTALSPDQKASLTSKLSQECSSESNQPALVELVSSFNSWLLDNNIDTTTETQSHEQNSKPIASKHKGKKKAKKEKSKVLVEEPAQVEKKPPMKTALDVIQRLQWDEAVDKACFIVGYMDRLVGLVERAFVDFTWEDLASVDHFTLAIPQHRIQYFKYKEEKVWDKNERLDNVFGSTGSKVTIVEAVEKYEAKLKQAAESAEKDSSAVQKVGAVGCDSVERTDGTCKTVGKTELGQEEDTDVLKDETEKSESQKATVSNPPVIPGAASSDPAPDAKHDAPDPRFEKKGKRNYFVALQITDKGVLNMLGRVQSELEDRYPQYSPYRNPENGMHLTLNALTLSNIDDMQRCVIAMNKIKPQLAELAMKSGPVSFKGVGNFGTKVVFARVDCPPELRDISSLIMKALIEEGVSVERKAFNPHLTILHVGKSDEWEKFDLSLRQYRMVQFGQQHVDNIQVCQMGTLPGMDEGYTGFYTTIFNLNIEK